MLRTIALFSFLFLLSCVPAKEQAALQQEEPKSNQVFDRNLTGTAVVLDDINPWVSLASQLMVIPGLYRQGEHIVARGGRAPLYVLDGTVIGRSLLNVSRIVWAGEIDKITYIRGGQALVYGGNTLTGVIVIETKWLRDAEDVEASE